MSVAGIFVLQIAPLAAQGYANRSVVPYQMCVASRQRNISHLAHQYRSGRVSCTFIREAATFFIDYHSLHAPR